MSDNNTSWQNIMLDIAGKNQPTEEAPVEVQNEEINPEVPTEEEEPNDPELVVEEPASEEPVEPQVEEKIEAVEQEEPEEVQSTEDGLIDDWASDDSEINDTEGESNIDFSSIVNDIGLKDVEVSNQGDLVKAISDKFSSYEEQINSMKDNVMPDNIPDSLKEAVKVASGGGNYEAYVNVSSINYDAISDEDLVANSLSPYFQAEDGSVNEEELVSYLDNMSDAQIKIEGNKIREQLKVNAESQKQSIIQEAERKRTQVFSEIDGALKSINEISGFKIQSHQKDIVRKAVKDDRIITDMFYSNGKFNGEKAVKAYLTVKYFDKMVNHLKTLTRNSTKKEIINEVSNAQIENRVSSPTPEKKEELSALGSWIEKLKTQ